MNGASVTSFEKLNKRIRIDYLIELWYLLEYYERRQWWLDLIWCELWFDTSLCPRSSKYKPIVIPSRPKDRMGVSIAKRGINYGEVLACCLWVHDGVLCVLVTMRIW